jgi:acetylornithine deacetylase/succinyl-diaminopimelate desuccinylase-like protein
MTETQIKQAVEHAHSNYDTYLENFKDLLRIPSVSTDAAYKGEINRAAEWVVAELKRLGFDKCAAMPSDGHPVVYGEWLKAGEDKATIIIYAHYDVQPVDPLELWDSPPFEPEVRDGKLYARGVVDDKIGVWGNLKAIESIMAATGTLPVNVKVFFEGEEETGSPSMEAFIKANKDLLTADLLIISDGGSSPGQPESWYSLRGIIGAEVNITGSEYDLHSGIGGGVVHNPIHMAGKIIASFHDDNGHILIPGAYEGALPLTEEEREKFGANEDDLVKSTRQGMGDFRLWGESEYGFVERMTARPSLDINGVFGGYQGKGSKTVIPSKAGFKVTMRIAPGQDPLDIRQKLVDHIKSFACDTVDIDVKVEKIYGSPVLMSSEGPLVDAMNKAYKAVWDAEMLNMRIGGSIPIVGMFQQVLGFPLVFFGLGSGGLVHSPNEYMHLDYFQINIDTAIHFYHYLADALGKQ